MTFDTYFRGSSYATIVSAMVVLLLAGGLHIGLAIGFSAVVLLAWKIEGTKWQLSERTGLLIVLLSVPLFIIDWQFQKASGEPTGRFGVTALAHLIIFLAAVKLLQVKKDRDWVFLYLISFFEVLLAAGLSFSPVFLGTLTIYLLCGLSTVIAFEIHKGKRSVPASETRLLVPPDSRIFNVTRPRNKRQVEATRLPWVAFTLMLLIFVLALPLFLVAPRSGAASFLRGGSGLSNFVGFSESVNLGEIGTLKRDNAVVMHVRVDGTQTGSQAGRSIRWRGVALDEFTGRGWRKSPAARRGEQKTNERGLFQLGTTESLNRLTAQTVFLEPIESPVLFAATRPVAIQGDFLSVRVDAEGSIQTRKLGFERLMYKALSDMTEPDPALLQRDRQPYPATFERYLQLPESLDPRIAARANAMIVNAHARNRYDIAKAIETQLQSDFGYSMQMKATGPDPLADFLFNVQAGHCEYFSTAMAVMLRTRGIAARVVNGFLPGEYNEAADAFTVRQSDAHSWVEVYFPESRSWVTFDPTPAAGRSEAVSTGIAAQFGKYAAALELLWFQYVVGYDKQEQRSLATYLNNQLSEFRRALSTMLLTARRALTSQPAAVVVLVSLVIILSLLLLALTRVRRFGWRRALRIESNSTVEGQSAVLFYERMMRLLEQRGLQRDAFVTPLEFAGATKLTPAISVTRAYNRVRFGGQQLSAREMNDIEEALRQLEEDGQARRAGS
jgi:transglutaminase-like putative cysteine protease